MLGRSKIVKSQPNIALRSMLGHNTLIPINMQGEPMRQQNKGQGKRHIHQVKVSEAEEALLKSKAEALNVSIVKLLVDSTLGKNQYLQRRALVTELVGVRRELQGVSTNINQMTRLANTTQQVPSEEELAAAFGNLEPLIERVWEVVKELQS